MKWHERPELASLWTAWHQGLICLDP
jgi:hypothetical protein